MGFVELGVVIALAVAALLSGFVVLPRRGSWLIVAGRRGPSGRGFSLANGATLRAPLLERVLRLSRGALIVEAAGQRATVRRKGDPSSIGRLLGASEDDTRTMARIALARAAAEAGDDPERFRAEAGRRLGRLGLSLDRLEPAREDDADGNRIGDRRYRSDR
ncbi:MAG: hypothetical protein KC776_35750 [Myxococcales bacterium]|nr:hypothetical protein [Myxococcales bacterium]MCB9578574.1 hypothetical protein [Polyangiaceae bacterium]